MSRFTHAVWVCSPILRTSSGAVFGGHAKLPSMGSISVVLADVHDVVRSGLRVLLGHDLEI